MCGICGVWGSISPETVERMVIALRHRGPDDNGMYTDRLLTLGMARLSVLDLSPTGHQPMSNPEQTIWIVYNGEMYNFRNERTLLKQAGYPFVSTSDTEVVLRMYEHYGDDFLSRMRGMFALAIYDKRQGPGKERLLLARDQFGIKPLLYAHTQGKLLFASELKALLASRLIEPRIDPIALRLLLTFGSVYQPYTLVQGVNMLLPAHRMIIEGGHSRIERYWALEVDRQLALRTMPYDEQVLMVSQLLKESVRLQLVSDVPLGAFLSGGIDSSVLVALMAKELGNQIKTFSVGFESEGRTIDESQVAQQTAQFLGTDHTHVLVTGKEVSNRIEHIAHSLDQPSVDGINSYFVSLAARQAVTVAISGTGGDELYAGYPWFLGMTAAQERQQQQPIYRRAALRCAAAIARHAWFDWVTVKRGNGRFYRLRSSMEFRSQYAQLYHIFGDFGAARILSREMRQDAQAGRAMFYDLQACDELADGSTIERVSGLCLRGYTANQLLRDIDAVSMAHSLEVRVPYLDLALVDSALSLPDTAKMGDSAGRMPSSDLTYQATGAKRILRDVGRPLLPPNFDAQPKRGFAMPFDAWLRGPLRDVFCDTLSDAQIKKRGIFDVHEASQIRQCFLEGRINWPRPWLLMMIELWFQQVLEASSSQKHEQKD